MSFAYALMSNPAYSWFTSHSFCFIWLFKKFFVTHAWSYCLILHFGSEIKLSVLQAQMAFHKFCTNYLKPGLNGPHLDVHSCVVFTSAIVRMYIKVKKVSASSSGGQINQGLRKTKCIRWTWIRNIVIRLYLTVMFSTSTSLVFLHIKFVESYLILDDGTLDILKWNISCSDY